MIKVSIIVPVYNMESKLEKCLNSLVMQTLKDIEVIIINDGSTDNSIGIINKYLKDYKNIVFINKNNEGIGAARNDGLNIARGKYIGFVDSDDYVELNMFERMYKLAEKLNLDLVICNYKSFNNINNEVIYSDVISSTRITTLEENPKMLNKIHFMPWNKLYKYDLFDNVRFPKNTKYEDLNTIIKVYSKAKKVFGLDEYLYNYFLNINGETLTVDKRIFDILKVLDDIIIYFKNEKSIKIQYEVEHLCVDKVVQYISLSYNLKDKQDCINFIKSSISFLNNNFKGYKIKYMRTLKTFKERLKFIIRTNLLFSKILLVLKHRRLK